MRRTIPQTPALHPAAELFPPLSPEKLARLADAIKARGLLHPIVLLDGAILDGRNRLAACALAGVEPRFVAAPPWAAVSPYSYAWDANAERRHLPDGQLGMIGLAAIEADPAWQARLAEARDAANRARSDKAKAQHAVSNPRKGEKYGGASQEAPPETPRKAAVAIAESIGVSRATVERNQAVRAKSPALAHAVAAGTVSLADALREVKRSEVVAKLDNTAARTAKAARGVYDVVIIDPPWPLKKIERDERPNQVALDYPTMSLDAIAALAIPAAEDCHLWLWTTHRFLPDAFARVRGWGFAYVCTFVWHKPGGFQPVGLPQFNCEFALYARKGHPKFVDTKALPVCFEAPRGKHSEKPEAFYATVRRVTAGRRLDMFNRRAIEGFDGSGQEAV